MTGKAAFGADLHLPGMLHGKVLKSPHSHARIKSIEGPVLAKRAYDIFLRSCGIKRMGHELKSTMNKVLADSIRQGRVVAENESAKGGLIFSVVRVTGNPPIKLRIRGPRSFEEIPPSELQVVAKYLAERDGLSSGSDEHLRAILGPIMIQPTHYLLVRIAPTK